MAEPFWQRSLDTISYSDVVSFLDEEVREGISLEYKGATLKQNGLPDFEKCEVLETLVAFANTSGGMMLYGVNEDDTTKLPVITTGIEATTEKAKRLLDPGGPLMDVCARRINPRIPMEPKQIVIEDGPATGNKLLLIRVRVGSQPPYSIDDRLIYMRTGEKDELATVTEIEALFRRRVDHGADTDLPAQMIAANIFDYASLAPPEDPQCLILTITPAFPVPIIRANADTDSRFKRLCLDIFRANDAIKREPRGIMYMPSLDPNKRHNPDCAMAFDDGSIGLRRVLGFDRTTRIDLAATWQKFRDLFYHGVRWPRDTFHYSGPLLCRFAMSNLDGVTVGDDVGAAGTPWSGVVAEPFRNRLPAWHESAEWSAGMTLDDLLEPVLASLARQLQYPYFESVVDKMRLQEQ